MSEPHKPVGAIFDKAIELTPDRRAAYLREACAGDDALRQRVEALIRAHDLAGTFMDGPAPQPKFQTIVIKSVEQPGDRIGRYKLLQQIGEGGCGVVYMAEQEEPLRRRVALKVIKLGMDTKAVVARFEAERQAMALMDYPNIAKVFDAGSTGSGRPYFVMELVHGIKITDYCDENNLSTVARLELFIRVCQAVQHAHQKGIIHRDIKPSNILVADHDGVPVPKIIDFGIAKATTDQRLTDKSLFTAFEQFIGTPAYMSPEQAKMSGLDIDTRSDIYSLGVLLYELLTGRTPFEAKRLHELGLDEIRRVIREEEPLRPSTKLNTLNAADKTTVAKHRQSEPLKLSGFIRGDLDWIVMKALEKDRSRRYETCNGLARDVQRFVEDEPVLARPPDKLYALRKLARRNKLAFAAAAVVIISLVLGLGVATVAVIRTKRAKDDATGKLRLSYLTGARAMRTSGRTGQRFDSLEAVRKAAAIRIDLETRNEAIGSLAVSDLRVSKRATLKGPRQDELARFDYKLDRYAVAGTNGSITVRAVADNRVVAELAAPGLNVRWVGSFSPDSRYLKAHYWGESTGPSGWVWDLDEKRAVLKELPGNWGMEFSDDSRLLAESNPDGTLSVFDLASAKELKRLPVNRSFQHLAFNPANTKLACFNEGEPRVDIRDVESGRSVLMLECPFPAQEEAWSPDGKRLAIASGDRRIYLCNAENGRVEMVLPGHDEVILNVAFNHEGNLLASAGNDGQFLLWSLSSGRQIATYPGYSLYFQFSRDDRSLEGWREVSHYGSLEVGYSQECRLIDNGQRFGYQYSGPEFSADGRILAAASSDGVCFWDVFSGKKIASLPEPVCEGHIFHPDGRSLIVADLTGGVYRRTLEQIGGTVSPTFRLGKARQFCQDPDLREVALSRNGRYLAVTKSGDGESIIHDLENPAVKVVLRNSPLVAFISISPDGRWAATSSWYDLFVRVWDARTGDLVRVLPMPDRARAVFSSDGRWLATSTSEYQLWEVGSWQPKGPAVPGDPVGQFNFTEFSPDGRVMARTMEARKIQLVEVLTGKALATLEAPSQRRIVRFQFSPDGSQLAAQQQDQQMQLWDLRLIRQELAQMGLDWDMPPYPPLDKGATGPITLEVESDGPVPTVAR